EHRGRLFSGGPGVVEAHREVVVPARLARGEVRGIELERAALQDGRDVRVERVQPDGDGVAGALLVLARAALEETRPRRSVRPARDDPREGERDVELGAQLARRGAGLLAVGEVPLRPRLRVAPRD